MLFNVARADLKPVVLIVPLTCKQKNFAYLPDYTPSIPTLCRVRSAAGPGPRGRRNRPGDGRADLSGADRARRACAMWSLRAIAPL